MAVAVKDLLPNPYRKIERYQLQPERLNALVRSIKDTSFWDNILARPNPDGSETYQIAYGHHRVEAVKTCIREAGFDGGYVCSTSNMVHSGVDPELYHVMVDAIHQYGQYPLDMEYLAPAG